MPVRNLHNEIYESLRLSIIMGDFVPGQVFSTRGIADRFGTSLMPARDAMKRLVAERGLELLPNRSFCIPKMSRQRFQELLQVRMYLESVLTERACAVLSPEGLRSIESINEDQEATGSKQRRDSCTDFSLCASDGNLNRSRVLRRG